MNIDFSNIYSSKIGIEGLNDNDFDKISNILQNAQEKFNDSKNNYGFINITYDKQTVEKIKEVCNSFGTELENVVVVGIGGSDLGVRAVHRALNHQYHNQIKNKKGRNIYFIGDTTDPTEIIELLDLIELEKSLFIIISKSGDTIEPAIAYAIIKDKLSKIVVEDKKHFLMLTDENNGELRSIVNKFGYASLPIPENVGGRFSVLTCVGLAPLYFSGINIEELINGAKDSYEYYYNLDILQNDALKYAAVLYLYYFKGHNINVMMPYIYSFKEFGAWFRQLWAESLGKVDKDGHNVGSTPISALGPTDQHSQLQLYNEGPNDKFITFITTNNFNKDIDIPSNLIENNFLSSHKLSKVINMELSTTAYSLTLHGRPNCIITLDNVSEKSLGQLIMFFELVITYSGFLYNINVFDQPGVEMSKKVMYGLLGNTKFQKESDDFNKYINSNY